MYVSASVLTFTQKEEEQMTTIADVAVFVNDNFVFQKSALALAVAYYMFTRFEAYRSRKRGRT